MLTYLTNFFKRNQNGSELSNVLTSPICMQFRQMGVGKSKICPNVHFRINLKNTCSLYNVYEFDIETFRDSHR